MSGLSGVLSGLPGPAADQPRGVTTWRDCPIGTTPADILATQLGAHLFKYSTVSFEYSRSAQCRHTSAAPAPRLRSHGLYDYDTDMNAVHITRVPPETINALKRLARSHHRSLQGELRVILERAARMAPPEGATAELKLVTVRTGYTGSWSREEIYGADGR